METMKRIATQVMLVAALALGWAMCQAENSAQLEACVECHGDDGASDDSQYPHIAGIPAEIQADALRAYRDGKRHCGPVPEMCEVADSLSEEEIVELADYYAAKPFTPADQEFDPELAAQGALIHEDYCEICHGSGPEDSDNSILHGQWAGYLRYSLGQYGSGARKQPPSMRRQTEKLTETDVDALVNYYASYR